MVSRELEKECIVVFDEAHNIDNVCIEALSVNLRQQTLRAARGNITKLENVRGGGGAARGRRGRVGAGWLAGQRRARGLCRRSPSRMRACFGGTVSLATRTTRYMPASLHPQNVCP